MDNCFFILRMGFDVIKAPVRQSEMYKLRTQSHPLQEHGDTGGLCSGSQQRYQLQKEGLSFRSLHLVVLELDANICCIHFDDQLAQS